MKFWQTLMALRLSATRPLETMTENQYPLPGLSPHCQAVELAAVNWVAKITKVPKIILSRQFRSQRTDIIWRKRIASRPPKLIAFESSEVSSDRIDWVSFGYENNCFFGPKCFAKLASKFNLETIYAMTFGRKMVTFTDSLWFWVEQKGSEGLARFLRNWNWNWNWNWSWNWKGINSSRDKKSVTEKWSVCASSKISEMPTAAFWFQHTNPVRTRVPEKRRSSCSCSAHSRVF